MTPKQSGSSCNFATTEETKRGEGEWRNERGEEREEEKGDKKVIRGRGGEKRR